MIRQKQTFWTCLSWDGPRAFRCLFQKDDINKLIKVAGGWEELCLALMDEKELPSAEILAATRDLMQVKKFIPEYFYLLPTQEWVAKCLREFVNWHIEEFGEPSVEPNKEIAAAVEE